jgi:L-fuconolactonase
LEPERKAAGVTAGVLVQAANTTQETTYMLDVAKRTDWIKGVVGWLPLMDPQATEKLLAEQYAGNTLFKGVRHLIHDEPDAAWLLQDDVIESLRILATYKMPYDVVGVLPAHMVTALKVAEKIPGLRIVFDHLNQPPIKAKEKYGVWGDLAKQAASHPNFCMKISGLGVTAQKSDNWNEEDVKPYIAFVLEHYGANRCFCGGDWPVSLLAGAYAKTWRIYENVLNELLDAAALKQVLYSSAASFYNL